MSRRLALLALALGAVGLVLVPLLVGLRANPDEPGRPGLVGRHAPPLTGSTLGGTPFDAREIAGHAVLVNVWASWCLPCREELPLLLRTEERLAPAGLRVVTINTRDGPDAARALLAEVGADALTTVVDPDGRLAVSWGAHGVPETFLVDRAGVIRAFRPGAITDGWIREHVDPLLRAP